MTKYYTSGVTLRKGDHLPIASTAGSAQPIVTRSGGLVEKPCSLSCHTNRKQICTIQKQ